MNYADCRQYLLKTWDDQHEAESYFRIVDVSKEQAASRLLASEFSFTKILSIQFEGFTKDHDQRSYFTPSDENIVRIYDLCPMCGDHTNYHGLEVNRALRELNSYEHPEMWQLCHECTKVGEILPSVADWVSKVLKHHCLAYHHEGRPEPRPRREEDAG